MDAALAAGTDRHLPTNGRRHSGAAKPRLAGGLLADNDTTAGQWSSRPAFNDADTGLNGSDAGARLWLIAGPQLSRLGQQHELDAAVVFLASPASSYITGSTLAVDGGMSGH